MTRRIVLSVHVALSTAALHSGQHFERLHSMLPDREALQGVVADFDGDGDLDTVFRLSGQELHVNENDGTGLFRSRLRGSAAADPGLAGTAVVSDVDQDLDPDLIFPLLRKPETSTGTAISTSWSSCSQRTCAATATRAAAR